MIVRNKTLLLGLVAVALLCSIVPHQPALSQESAQTPTPLEQAAIFEWFDGLGFKNFAKQPLASLETAMKRQTYEDFAETVKTALNSAYNKPFEIRYSLIRNQ